MKKNLTPAVLVAILSMFVAWTALPDAEFSYSNSVSFAGHEKAVAKTPVIVTATNGPVSIAAITNLWAGAKFTRTIQNLGTNAVYYHLGGTVASTNLNGVIAGGLAVKDGLGSVCDIGNWPGSVTVMTASGTSDVVVSTVIQ